jgi:hypothetical protein
VHRSDEKIGQVIQDLGAARGQEGGAQGFWMAAQLVGLFYGDAMAISAQDLRRHAGEKVLRQRRCSQELELGERLLDALKARAAWVSLEEVQQRDVGQCGVIAGRRQQVVEPRACRW